MKNTKGSIVTTLLLTMGLLCATTAADAQNAAPDYGSWGRLLQKYYDPARGMDYAGLKKNDLGTLRKLRDAMATVNVDRLNRNDQLAYWINLYNISVAGIVAEAYPVASIRELSTDPIIRLNVFKKDSVKRAGGMMSLNDIENDRIREGFKDPRIHFAINCAARSCPSIRQEPFVGSRLDQQLDDQARHFLNGPNGMRVSAASGGAVVKTTKIMDWFSKDFDASGGGVAFMKKYASPETRRVLEAAGPQVKVEFDEYDWSLNDWKR